MRSLDLGCAALGRRRGSHPRRRARYRLGSRPRPGSPLRFDPDLSPHGIGPRPARHLRRRTSAERRRRGTDLAVGFQLDGPRHLAGFRDRARSGRPERPPRHRAPRADGPRHASARVRTAGPSPRAARRRRDHHRAGTVTLGDTLRYELRDGRIERVDVAALSRRHHRRPALGPIRARGRGTAPGAAIVTAGRASGRAALRIAPSRAGGRGRHGSIVAACASRARARRRADGWCWRRSGVRSTDRLLRAPPRRARGRGPRHASSVGPDLAGPVTLSLSRRGPHPRHCSLGDGSCSPSDSSRLGRLRAHRRQADLRLAGERLTTMPRRRRTGGALSLAGDGTMGPRPAYRVREGRLTAVDLGALLGRPDLRTDLNTTFTAELAGPGARQPARDARAWHCCRPG